MLWIESALLIGKTKISGKSVTFKSQSGFTLIEILVVLALMGMLLALSAPFVNSLRSDVAMQKTLRQIKSDLIQVLSYSVAGKSLSPKSLDSELNIPAAYALHFSISEAAEDQAGYKYMELGFDETSSDFLKTPIYEKGSFYDDSGVFLKKIILIGETESLVDSVYIVALPPFGKLIFLPAQQNLSSHFSYAELEKYAQDYSEIQFILQYKDLEIATQTITLSKNKVLQIL